MKILYTAQAKIHVLETKVLGNESMLISFIKIHIYEHIINQKCGTLSNRKVHTHI